MEEAASMEGACSMEEVGIPPCMAVAVAEAEAKAKAKAMAKPTAKPTAEAKAKAMAKPTAKPTAAAKAEAESARVRELEAENMQLRSGAAPEAPSWSESFWNLKLP